MHKARSVLELTVLQSPSVDMLTCLQSRQAPAGEHLGFRRARGEIREQSRRHEAWKVLQVAVLHISALGLRKYLQTRKCMAAVHQAPCDLDRIHRQVSS